VRARPLVALAGAVLVSLVGMWGFYGGGGLYQICAFSIVSLGCGCLLVASIGARSLRMPWPSYFGRISYGLYVFHGPALIVGEMVGRGPIIPLTTLLTFCISSLSYRYLESPFPRLKKRFENLPSRPS
jgi:peptidoglycan/LPS O-acetylase OafA/YrhL